MSYEDLIARLDKMATRCRIQGPLLAAEAYSEAAEALRDLSKDVERLERALRIFDPGMNSLDTLESK